MTSKWICKVAVPIAGAAVGVALDEADMIDFGPSEVDDPWDAPSLDEPLDDEGLIGGLGGE